MTSPYYIRQIKYVRDFGDCFFSVDFSLWHFEQLLLNIERISSGRVCAEECGEIAKYDIRTKKNLARISKSPCLLSTVAMGGEIGNAK